MFLLIVLSFIFTSNLILVNHWASFTENNCLINLIFLKSKQVNLELPFLKFKLWTFFEWALNWLIGAATRSCFWIWDCTSEAKKRFVWFLTYFDIQLLIATKSIIFLLILQYMLLLFWLFENTFIILLHVDVLIQTLLHKSANFSPSKYD